MGKDIDTYVLSGPTNDDDDFIVYVATGVKGVDKNIGTYISTHRVLINAHNSNPFIKTRSSIATHFLPANLNIH